LSTFQKSVERIQVSLKSEKNKGFFTWQTIYLFDHTRYLAHFFIEGEMFHTTVVQKIKAHTSYSITFFEYRAVYEIMWKNFAGPGSQQVAI
jgi:hypothetical protein